MAGGVARRAAGAPLRTTVIIWPPSGLFPSLRLSLLLWPWWSTARVSTKHLGGLCLFNTFLSRCEAHCNLIYPWVTIANITATPLTHTHPRTITRMIALVSHSASATYCLRGDRKMHVCSCRCKYLYLDKSAQVLFKDVLWMYWSMRMDTCTHRHTCTRTQWINI